MAKQQTHDDLNITGEGAYVHNWVKWLKRESEHKPLSDVELTSGDTILCLYMSVGSV
jgi:hypothetical protein